jgi:hypothetical protein
MKWSAAKADREITARGLQDAPPPSEVALPQLLDLLQFERLLLGYVTVIDSDRRSRIFINDDLRIGCSRPPRCEGRRLYGDRRVLIHRPFGDLGQCRINRLHLTARQPSGAKWWRVNSDEG